MNSDWIVVPNRAATPPTLSELRVTLWDTEVDSPVTTYEVGAADGLVVEPASLVVRRTLETPPADFLFRLRGLPSPYSEHRCVVELTNGGLPPTVIDVLSRFMIGGTPVRVGALYGTFAPAAGSLPVTVTVVEDETGDPLVGVELSVWTADLATAVAPLIRTTSAGIARCALPPGAYKVFPFKPFAVFVAPMPATLVVPAGGVGDITIRASLQMPSYPPATRITLYGTVLDTELRPVSGVEVKLRVLNTPQQLPGAANATRQDVVRTTDSNGKFEFYPAGGLAVWLTCEAAGYSQKGRLPLAGRLSWTDLGKETAE